MNRIRVCVFLRAGRRHFEAQWVDPITGRKRTRSTGEARRGEALRAAARIEAELESGKTRTDPRIEWAAFWERYESEVLSGLALKSRQKARSTYNAVCDLIGPRLARALTAEQISLFQSRLRAGGLAEPTIKSHLSCLRAALRWGQKMGLIETVPAFAMPRRTRGMKGRPITAEEFERMIAALRHPELAAAIPDADRRRGWEHLLRGLWWSGLRLGEALALHWTDDRQLCVDLAGDRPMFRVQAAAEKGNRFRLLPVAPEFAELLHETPLADRRGYVFRPEGRDGRVGADWASHLISRLGKLAGVKVAERPSRDEAGQPVQIVKYASAHDFRRAFGTRWSLRVMPVILQQMMRHESIQTTMEFYVGHQAQQTAEAIWAAFASTSGDRSKTANRPAAAHPIPAAGKGECPSLSPGRP